MSGATVCGCGGRVWEATYAHDRRKHRHRCRACERIIDSGERVLMIRIPRGRGTWAIHAEHADERLDGMSWRERLSAWAAPDGCRKCGGSGVLPGGTEGEENVDRREPLPPDYDWKDGLRDWRDGGG